MTEEWSFLSHSLLCFFIVLFCCQFIIFLSSVQRYFVHFYANFFRFPVLFWSPLVPEEVYSGFMLAER